MPRKKPPPKRYRVKLTRDVRHVATIEVLGWDEEDAKKMAEAAADAPHSHEWVEGDILDETFNVTEIP